MMLNLGQKPFLKWAGGKRWLVRKYWEHFPKSYAQYYEPFLGSGAVFFAFCPEHGVIADSNHDLIETYQAIRLNWKLVYKYLHDYAGQHSAENYYYIRSLRPASIYARAARFIYLNRTCWNGLYRVNMKGEFNVPKGTKDNILLETDDWKGVSSALRKVDVIEADYLDVIERARRNDFVFLDPPVHNQDQRVLCTV